MYPPSPLDCVIVLGARLNPRGEPGRVAQLRLRHALTLWREHHPGCRVLLTGGQRPGTATSEARAMARWSLAWTQDNWGLEAREQLAACLVLEEASHNTAASAANTLPLVQGLGVKAVGLVSDSLHFRRAHYLFRAPLRPPRHPGPFPAGPGSAPPLLAATPLLVAGQNGPPGRRRLAEGLGKPGFGRRRLIRNNASGSAGWNRRLGLTGWAKLSAIKVKNFLIPR